MIDDVQALRGPPQAEGTLEKGFNQKGFKKPENAKMECGVKKLLKNCFKTSSSHSAVGCVQLVVVSNCSLVEPNASGVRPPSCEPFGCATLLVLKHFLKHA
jgi:hypothetical protein